MARRLRGVSPRVERAVTCRYTLTPDEHFVVDRLATSEIVVSACSGHGFKFSAVIGDVIADLALRGATARDVSHFRLARLVDGEATGQVGQAARDPE